MDRSSRIYVAGHRGLVGSAICRRLREDGYSNLIVRGRGDLDLFDRPAVDAFFAREKPEYVFLAAAKVGGILANSTYPVEFLRDNLAIQLNVLDAGCCGMAGSFGMMESKYELSLKIAEPLVEQIKQQPYGTTIVLSGTSCRHQVQHLMTARTMHMAEVLAEALA